MGHISGDDTRGEIPPDSAPNPSAAPAAEPPLGLDPAAAVGGVAVASAAAVLLGDHLLTGMADAAGGDKPTTPAGVREERKQYDDTVMGRPESESRSAEDIDPYSPTARGETEEWTGTDPDERR